MANEFVSKLSARLVTLDNPEVIRQKVTKIPVVQSDMAAIPVHLISNHIGELLGALYVPTVQELDLLQKLAQTARAHCETTYQSDEKYFKGLYTHYDDLPVNFQAPICLTGPAGVGKTSVLLAMRRLLPEPCEIDLGYGHSPVSIHSHWHAQVQERSTVTALLEPLIRAEMDNANKKSKLAVSLSAKIAFKSGVSLFMLDELQFLTQSASANTAVTKFLYQLCYLGMPFVFAANYSLCRLLQRRPEQDRQRLLSSPIVLTPSAPDSPDWANYLQAVQRLLGSSLQIDLHEERHTLHHLTAGLKRLVVHLLKLAYDLAWRDGNHHVGLLHIRQAYDCTQYAVNRQQAEVMLSPHSRRSAEYECPFPLPKVPADELIQAKNRAHTKKIMENIQRDALLQSEKKALGITAPSKAPKQPKRARLTADELRQSNLRRLNSGSPD